MSLTLAGLVAVCRGKVDLTRQDKVVGAAVVEAVVDLIGESCVFDDDALFLRRIAYVETMDGRSSEMFTKNGTGYYGGIWRVSWMIRTLIK